MTFATDSKQAVSANYNGGDIICNKNDNQLLIMVKVTTTIEAVKTTRRSQLYNTIRYEISTIILMPLGIL